MMSMIGPHTAIKT